ncbi:TniB family NTP-binding protein [Dechloromonas sp.]|uniref:TniB family NTP-binding protein n=1 Tax=Dechloromonas sp. TaxID=1917218 RepID=UPI00263F8AB7|nr:TniB family NTP-binding protein [Dechloromonas sp.]
MNNLRTIVETTLVPHTAFEDATQRLEQCFAYASGASEPICIALVGESRTGKSRVLEECFSRHPRIRNANGLNTPILRVKTPSKPTVKSLAELMLRALGDPKAHTGSENTKTARLLTLMVESGVMMVMIDEFQHFYDKGSHKVMHHVADWLKILVDDARVALVVAGLPTCRAVIEQNEQLAGRFLSPVYMPRFNWQDIDQREEFIAILGAFQESIGQCFDLPRFTGDEMAFRFYCGTGGLIGYLSKFLRQAVWNAIDANSKSIDLSSLLRAHSQSIWAQDGPTGLPSPFDRRFSTEVTDDLLARINKIGVPADEVRIPRNRAARQTGELGVQAVLTAR